MNEDEEQEDAVVYEFVTTGERTCERCMALAGSQWREPPDPPHAHCECEVVPVVTGVHSPRDCGDNTWSMEAIPGGESTVRYGPGGLGGFEWGFNVTIDCWDGGLYEFEMWVDIGKDSDWPGGTDAFDDMDAFAWSELYDQAEAVSAQVCSPCEAPLVS
jgi:hypothetical protein